MVTSLAGNGTSESTWLAWQGLAALPVLPVTPLPARVVVLAPHPDDEVLGVGGLITLLIAAEVEVLVVAVSQGEASHPYSPTTSTAQLARTRRDEQSLALHRLGLHHRGLSPSPIHRCALPDGQLHRHETALVEALAAVLDERSWCVSTWAHDGHPDHEAVGRAAAVAASRAGTRLLEYPIWTWHWAQPGDPRVPWDSAYRIDLPPAIRATKQHAITAFSSQIEPLSPQPGDEVVLAPHILARLTRPYEVVFG